MKRWSIVCGAAMIVLLAVGGCSIADLFGRGDGERVLETPEGAEGFSLPPICHGTGRS